MSIVKVLKVSTIVSFILLIFVVLAIGSRMSFHPTEKRIS